MTRMTKEAEYEFVTHMQDSDLIPIRANIRTEYAKNINRMFGITSQSQSYAYLLISH